MGRFPVVVTATAEADILDIVDWLATYSGPAADRFIDEVERVFIQLAEFPLSGRRRSPLKENRRVIVRDAWVVTYEFTGRRITVRRIVHGAREREPF